MIEIDTSLTLSYKITFVIKRNHTLCQIIFHQSYKIILDIKLILPSHTNIVFKVDEVKQSFQPFICFNYTIFCINLYLSLSYSSLSLPCFFFPPFSFLDVAGMSLFFCSGESFNIRVKFCDCVNEFIDLLLLSVCFDCVVVYNGFCEGFWYKFQSRRGILVFMPFKIDHFDWVNVWPSLFIYETIGGKLIKNFCTKNCHSKIWGRMMIFSSLLNRRLILLSSWSQTYTIFCLYSQKAKRRY